MDSSALEEKINKIRLQNEEIKRRYEEVEADKKNAAKLNALVQLVPSDDWPERKEPPEFSAPPTKTQKPKILNKELHNDRQPQHYLGIQDRPQRKEHKFSQGNGPPPDPKYNFLADSEREMRLTDDSRLDEDKNRSRVKAARGAPRRRGAGGANRDAYFKDNRGPQAFYSKEEALPEYEAWRAERNRIDEARINRQKTAEGNWRREWDSNKMNTEKDSLRKGEPIRKDSNNFERRNNHYDSDFSNRGHGGSRTYHGTQKSHGHQDYRRPYQEQQLPYDYTRQPDNKAPLSPTDDRTVTAADKSIKVLVNQAKAPVMSVKVNSPSIAGTGRVGPRQKSRITYSSQSDAEMATYEISTFSRQKSFDEKTAASNFPNGQKSSPKSPFSQRKNPKSPHSQRKEFRSDDSSLRSKNPAKASSYSQRNEARQSKNYSTPKPQRPQKRASKPTLEDDVFISDDAIPFEYNPDKLVGYENFTESNDASTESNEIVYGDLAGVPNDSDYGVFNADCTYDSVDNASNENDETNEVIESNKTIDNEHIEINVNIENAETEEIVERVEMRHEKDYVQVDENIVNNEIITDEINEGKKGEEPVLFFNDTLQDTTKEEIINELPVVEMLEQKIDLCSNTEQGELEVSTGQVQAVPCEEIQTNESADNQKHNEKQVVEYEQKKYLCVDNQEKINPEILNEEPRVLTSNKNKNEEIEVTEAQSSDQLQESANDGTRQTTANLETDDSVVKVADNIVNESMEAEGNETTELDISKNNNSQANDSGFVDNNTTNESIQSAETSINDSGFLNDADKLQNNSSTLDIESIDVGNAIEKETRVSVKSDAPDLTKEICEIIKTDDELCDTRCAESGEPSRAVHQDLAGKSEASETLENPITKDNDVNSIENANEKLIDVLQEATQKETQEHAKDELKKVADCEESKED